MNHARTHEGNREKEKSPGGILEAKTKGDQELPPEIQGCQQEVIPVGPRNSEERHRSDGFGKGPAVREKRKKRTWEGWYKIPQKRVNGGPRANDKTKKSKKGYAGGTVALRGNRQGNDVSGGEIKLGTKKLSNHLTVIGQSNTLAPPLKGNSMPTEKKTKVGRGKRRKNENRRLEKKKGGKN